jgi:hypothetical protein
MAVRTATLDSFKLEGVSLIKIDVEGHEDEVLSGATDTIANCRPVLVVEIEARHRRNAPMRLLDLLASWNYQGYYLVRERGLFAIQDFAWESQQTASNLGSGRYINNFLFVPSEISVVVEHFRQ